MLVDQICDTAGACIGREVTSATGDHEDGEPPSAETLCGVTLAEEAWWRGTTELALLARCGSSHGLAIPSALAGKGG